MESKTTIGKKMDKKKISLFSFFFSTYLILVKLSIFCCFNSLHLHPPFFFTYTQTLWFFFFNCLWLIQTYIVVYISTEPKKTFYVCYMIFFFFFLVCGSNFEKQNWTKEWNEWRNNVGYGKKHRIALFSSSV